MAIEFVGASSGQGPTAVVNRPPGVMEGDALIAMKWGGGTNVPAPAGWSLRASINDPISDDLFAMFYRVAEADEPVSYTFVNTSGGNVFGLQVLAYRGVNRADIFGGSADVYTEGMNRSFITTSGMTVPLANSTLVMTGLALQNVTSPPSGMTMRSSMTTVPGNFHLVVFDQIGLPAGETGERSAPVSSPTLTASYLTALRPAGDSPPPPTAKPWTRAFIVE